jgi:hypothetical protein
VFLGKAEKGHKKTTALCRFSAYPLISESFLGFGYATVSGKHKRWKTDYGKKAEVSTPRGQSAAWGYGGHAACLQACFSDRFVGSAVTATVQGVSSPSVNFLSCARKHFNSIRTAAIKSYG